MGHTLRRMIRDGATAEWSSLMRLVAYEIADDARDPDESHPLVEGRWPWSAIPVESEWRNGVWREGLDERCGMSARAISRVLTGLAALGYDMRQPIMDRDGEPVRDRRGKLVYAANGHAVRFWVPLLPPRARPARSPESAAFSDERSPDLATSALSSPPESASITGSWSPDLATLTGGRSPLLALKVAGIGDPVPPVSPQPPTSKISPLSPGVLSAAHREESQPAEDEDPGDESISENLGGGRQCRYAPCRTPEVPVEPGHKYHTRCKAFAAIKARRKLQEASDASLTPPLSGRRRADRYVA